MSYGRLGKTSKLVWETTNAFSSTQCRRLAITHRGQARQCSYITREHDGIAADMQRTPIAQLASSIPSSEWLETQSGMEKHLFHHACTIRAELSPTIDKDHVSGLGQLSK